MYVSLMNRVTIEELKDIVQNSTSFKEVLRKLGYTSNSGDSTRRLREKLNENNISYEHFVLNQNNQKRTFDNIFCKDSTADQKTLRKWYYNGQYTEYKCSICGQLPF